MSQISDDKMNENLPNQNPTIAGIENGLRNSLTTCSVKTQKLWGKDIYGGDLEKQTKNIQQVKFEAKFDSKSKLVNAT